MTILIVDPRIVFLFLQNGIRLALASMSSRDMFDLARRSMGGNISGGSSLLFKSSRNFDCGRDARY
jgi:hypothetical protein